MCSNIKRNQWGQYKVLNIEFTAPLGVKITKRAFGRDRRYPMTHDFREN